MRFASIVQIIANLSTVAAVVMLAVAVNNSRVAIQGTGSNALVPYHAGDRFEEIDGVELDKGRQTLFLAVRSGCHFCTESLPFYRRLAVATSRSGVRLVALALEPVETTAVYLKSANVEVEQIAEIKATQLPHLRATPTLVLVDRDGKVIDSWVGKLSDKKEEEVLGKLGSNAGS